MKKNFSKLLYSCTIIILVVGVNASLSKVNFELTDDIADVSSKVTDILTVKQENSKITITTMSSFTNMRVDSIGTILVLFDSDGNDNYWEAGIVYAFTSTGSHLLFWSIDGITADTNWNANQATNSYLMELNTLQLTFNEFSDCMTSKFLVISLEFNTATYTSLIDWAPNSYENKLNSNKISQILPEMSFGQLPDAQTSTSTVSTRTRTFSSSTSETFSSTTSSTSDPTKDTNSSIQTSKTSISTYHSSARVVSVYESVVLSL